ncbi:MAG: diguanylate cyclase [Syntrophorhabdaceae bacterium]|nr:diguanylate cyclase [Syntrophorhabdaceae bacterium]
MAEETFISKAGDILRSGKPIEESLKEWCDSVSDFIGEGIVSVLLFDQDSDDFFIKASTCKFRYNIPEIYFASKGSLEKLALTERRAIVLEERVFPDESRRRGAAMMVPLFSQNEPIGVLVLHAVSESGLSRKRQFVISEVAKFLADVVGSSIREESVALRMTKMSAINEAGINIVSTLDIAKLLKLASATACMIMEAEACIIRLLDRETGKYSIREYYGSKTEAERKNMFLLDKKAVARVLKGEPLLARNLSEDKSWGDLSDAARTLICLPLRGGGDILGTVTIIDKLPHKSCFLSSFTSKDMETFSRFAQYVEKAVSNSIVYSRNDEMRNLDGLTGLPTLKYFRDRLMNEVSRAKRFGRRLVLLVCEVRVRVHAESSIHSGHMEDQVIRQVAKAIRGTLREYDVVARISDTKFGMILPETDNGNMSAVNRINKAITAEVEQIRQKIKDTAVDARFGYAVFPDDGDDQEKLIFQSNIIKV